MPNPINLVDAARYFKEMDHQVEAFQFLDSNVEESVKKRFAEIYRQPNETTHGKLVTEKECREVFGNHISSSMLRDLNLCLERFKINKPLLIAHFFAQIGHESGGLRFFKEFASGEDYEGRRDLGNVVAGDGKKYKGAGALQITGRYNYSRFAIYTEDSSVMEGCDYVASNYPFTSAGFWWHENHINSFIENGATCREVSARVNGKDPANGLEDREAYFEKAKKVFMSTPATPVTQATGSLLLRKDKKGWPSGYEKWKDLTCLELQYFENSELFGVLPCSSGAPGHQSFRVGRDSRSGSNEPLPQGEYRVGDIVWASGQKDNWEASWGPGLGPIWIDLRYISPGRTDRSAIGIHLDANLSWSPGSAGCLVFHSIRDLKKLIEWLRRTDPRTLRVDWGI
jgi:predicted chitinase